MTDQVEQIQTNNPDQLTQIKAQLITSVSSHYREFINKVRNMPINPHIKTRSFNFFDDGFVWLKEGILNIQLNLPPLAPDVPIDNAQPIELKTSDNDEPLDAA